MVDAGTARQWYLSWIASTDHAFRMISPSSRSGGHSPGMELTSGAVSVFFLGSAGMFFAAALWSFAKAAAQTSRKACVEAFPRSAHSAR